MKLLKKELKARTLRNQSFFLLKPFPIVKKTACDLMKTEEMKTMIRTLNELNESYGDLTQDMKRTINQGIRRRTIYVEDVHKTLHDALKEVCTVMHDI
jgi:hypothetical protein